MIKNAGWFGVSETKVSNFAENIANMQFKLTLYYFASLKDSLVTNRSKKLKKKKLMAMCDCFVVLFAVYMTLLNGLASLETIGNFRTTRP